MKVLITGGAGFIGSHLAERLIGESHQVAILDDLNDYYSPALKRANLQLLRSAGPCEAVEGDIRDQRLVADLLRRAKPDCIVHLAARAGVRPSLVDPVLYEQVNVGGTTVLLEEARKVGVPRFVFASSSSIYGVANRVPFSEEDQLNLPISPYAATKIAGEKICYTYSHLYGIQVTCLRFFTVYGPRQRPDLAIRKFMRRIDQGLPIPVFGDGGMGRDYTFVEDTVAGIRAAIDYNCPYDVFNLGNSHPVLLSEMIATLERVLGRQAVIDRQPLQPGDVPITYADIGKAQALLGYAPRTPFEEGIRRMVEWYRRDGHAQG